MNLENPSLSLSQEQAQQLFQQMQQQSAELQHLRSIVAQQQEHVPAAPAVRFEQQPRVYIPKVSRPKPFTGASLSQNLDQWLMSLTLHFEATRNSDPVSQAQVAVTLLEDAALQWWMSVRKQLETQGRNQDNNPVNFDEFCRLIRVRYSPIEEKNTARIKLLELKQLNSSVQEYCSRSQRLSNILSDEFQEVTMVAIFINGLKPDIALHVEMNQPKTMIEAMSIAQRVEETSRHISHNRNNNRSLHQYRPSNSQRYANYGPSYHNTAAPMELGHVNGDHHYSEQDQLEEEPQEEAHLNAAYDSRGSGNRFRRPPQRRGHSLKRLDDAVFAKRQAEGLCFECGKPGHQGRECPVRTARLSASRPKNV